LNEPDLAHHSPEMPHVDAAAWFRRSESLRTKCDPSGRVVRDRSHVFTIIVASTLSE
jgi:hypothetical protein